VESKTFLISGWCDYCPRPILQNVTSPAYETAGRGRIRDADIAAIRDAVRIEDVVAEHVTLKRAGGGGLVGLCPFHDERSPSFHVTPARQFWYCFGCSQGGDAISFVRQVEHLSFTEAVEKLAGKYKIELHYEEGGRSVPSLPSGQRSKLVFANNAAAEYYKTQLDTTEGETGLAYMAERGFTREDLARFEVGYSPQGWDNLILHLKEQGVTEDELVTVGLAVARDNGSGIYDRFRGRLMWPIRDLTGDVIGFGARKLYEEDQGPKYLNTPETPLYHKSEVLYGIHGARKNIANTKKAVVVEGYTDVMACHLSGVETAVAACGTAFGDGHIKILRRLILDNDMYTGKVIFTFDGDAAGQKAALRAFKENQRFTAATYVAIAPEGMDPSELRQNRGAEAVKALVDSAVPLVEFALKTAINATDHGTVEGRTSALRAAAPILANIRDLPMRSQYVTVVAGWLGIDEHIVKDATYKARNNQQKDEGVTDHSSTTGANLRAPALEAEREALKLLLQSPEFATGWESIEDSAFTAEPYLAVWKAWREHRGSLMPNVDEKLAPLIAELTVDPLPVAEVNDAYARAVIARLLDRDCERRISMLKGKMAQGEAGESALADLLALQKHRQELKAWGKAG